MVSELGVVIHTCTSVLRSLVRRTGFRVCLGCSARPYLKEEKEEQEQEDRETKRRKIFKMVSESHYRLA